MSRKSFLSLFNKPLFRVNGKPDLLAPSVQTETKMHAASNRERYETKTAVKEPNNQNVSNTRRDWFDGLGKQLRTMLKASYSPAVAPDASSSLCRKLPLKAADTLQNSLAKVAMSIATQQIMSYAFPGASSVSKREPRSASSHSTLTIQPYLHPWQHSPENSGGETSLESLLLRYGRVSHMVLTDASYNVFMSNSKNGALCYKIHKNVAVICGDPLCEPHHYNCVLREFQLEHRLSAQNIAFLGMSETFRQFAEEYRWVTVNFGVERAVNPLTNSILSGAGSKRIYAQLRQLLDPERGGMKLAIYNPARKRDGQLESDMMHIYEQWRLSREDSTKVQSYLTLLDFCSYPGELFYLFVRDKDGKMQGFGGLRRLGTNRGYHLDPCIEATSAQRGVADLLAIASMALLKSLNVGSLNLGYEPSTDLTNMTGTTKIMSWMLRSLYQQTNQLLQLEGKRKHNDRFKPDDTQNANLYLVFPVTRLPRIQQLLAVTATVHLNIQHILKDGFSRWVTSL